MAKGNSFSDMIKNSVAEKVLHSIGNVSSNGKKDDRTIFGVKLDPDDFEKVTGVIAGAASTIGPIIAKSREKTMAAAQSASENAPSLDKFEEQFNAVIGAVDKRSAEARDRVKAKADSAKEATTHAAADARERVKSTAETAREATAQAAEDARERMKSRADSAKEATAHAAVETKDAGKNLLGLGFWLAALGAAVYYLFMNEHRREQVMGAAKTSANVARGIVSEVRGEDGVFSS